MLDDEDVSEMVSDDRLVGVEADEISIIEELTVAELVSTLGEDDDTLEKSVVEGWVDDELEYGGFIVAELVGVLYEDTSALDDCVVIDRVVEVRVAEYRDVEGSDDDGSELEGRAVVVPTIAVGKDTGKHVDGNGVEYDHNGVDQDFESGPNCASTSRSTTTLATLSTSTPVFEAPSLWLQAPCSSITTQSVSHVYTVRKKKKKSKGKGDQIPASAVNVALSSGNLIPTEISAFPIVPKSIPKFISGCK